MRGAPPDSERTARRNRTKCSCYGKRIASGVMQCPTILLRGMLGNWDDPVEAARRNHGLERYHANSPKVANIAQSTLPKYLAPTLLDSSESERSGTSLFFAFPLRYMGFLRQLPPSGGGAQVLTAAGVSSSLEEPPGGITRMAIGKFVDTKATLLQTNESHVQRTCTSTDRGSIRVD